MSDIILKNFSQKEKREGVSWVFNEGDLIQQEDPEEDV